MCVRDRQWEIQKRVGARKLGRQRRDKENAESGRHKGEMERVHEVEGMRGCSRLERQRRDVESVGGRRV